MSSPHALYLTAELRRIEQAALSALPPGTLMSRAAAAVARRSLELLGARAPGASVLVLAGPGNNGGDALQAATLLMQAGARPGVMLCPEHARRPEDAQRAFDLAAAAGLPFIAADPDRIRNGTWDLAIDGLFGIGLARGLAGDYPALIDALNALACPVLAVDIPSGLDADTGMPAGGSGIAVRATHTLTFIGDKPGLHTGYGRDHAGEVTVDALGIPKERFFPVRLVLNQPPLFAEALRPRPHYSHKGSHGDVRLVGGARGMGGALMLAGRAALHAGAGRVFAGFLDAPPAYDDRQPELMCRRAEEMDFSSGVAVIGPGLGTSVAAAESLRRVLRSTMPAVLDADALNLIATDPQLRAVLRERQGEALLTPHPLEAARLLGTDTAAVQGDRIAAARRLAGECNAVVILKGSGSVIASPDGEAAINPTGNPALATGGTGDVLAGLAGALLAQGLTSMQAALAATWVHGTAADELVAEGVGPVGLTAGELAPAIRRAINRLIREYAGDGRRRS
ncbi:NAD(P)H-hydrate dehydratase [Noviherbaspirillum aridicola]|uniref:Bifunctional NAD(P)H-hydrate repair enzyme n=1 Tax=Noviherbaspirillum aridicola TaxID=2849687 RepID=A0ABQ4Q352_9BURK|nr:NAD(P)H-hydrate dehydratase [Noviherbaspirillum aridicola]GIZ51523.1 bifunctional NAD(P)H-hydrate repair enzyme [Noviherbaspirillum aridicola]